MTLEWFLNQLERARPNGDDTFTAACPAHEDRVASLSIGRSEDGAILVYCHAGCDAYAITAAVGKRLADLFPDDARPSIPRPGVLRIPGPHQQRSFPMLPRAMAVPPPVHEDDVARWADRLQATGNVLDRLLELKGWSAPTTATLGLGYDGRRITFPVRAPGGHLQGVLRYQPGGDPKMLATRGAPRELWPPPEHLPDGPIVVVEGEPDAVSATELGLPATALPGAGKWRTRWAERLADRVLIVVGDCDEPGRLAAERIRIELADRADVRIVDLDPDREDGHDLGDEVTAAVRRGAWSVGVLRRRLLAIADVDPGTVRHQALGRLRLAG